MENGESAYHIGFRIYKLSNKDKEESELKPNFFNNAANIVRKTDTWLNSREV